MNILLDNRPLSLTDARSGATVGEVIESAKRQIADTGRSIVSVERDAAQVTAAELERLLHQPAETVAGLNLVTGSPREVVLEALTESRRALGETFAELQDAASAFAGGDATGAMHKLAGCLGVWAQTHECLVQGGMFLGADFSAMELDGKPFTVWLDGLRHQLVELKDAIVAGDPVLLGDILRYELDETLQRWERMLTGFIEHVEENGAETIRS